MWVRHVLRWHRRVHVHEWGAVNCDVEPTAGLPNKPPELYPTESASPNSHRPKPSCPVSAVGLPLSGGFQFDAKDEPSRLTGRLRASMRNRRNPFWKGVYTQTLMTTGTGPDKWHQNPTVSTRARASQIGKWRSDPCDYCGIQTNGSFSFGFEKEHFLQSNLASSGGEVAEPSIRVGDREVISSGSLKMHVWVP